MLTWDARGFGDSGGTVTVDSPDAEARDVMALIDWLAQQPEAQLDAAGDPRVGMTGVSYAGGIELMTAALDKRIDAIAPIIAWHSPADLALQGGDGQGRLGVRALRRRRADAPRAGWTRTSPPRSPPAPTTGKLSAEDRAWFARRGPGDLVKQITVPTFIVEGTADTLFTLDEAITNYEILKANGVPAQDDVVLRRPRRLPDRRRASRATSRPRSSPGCKRYVAGDTAVDTGPAFEWLADDAQWRSAADYPVAGGRAARPPPAPARSRSTRPTPSPARSPPPAARANAVNVAVPRAGRRARSSASRSSTLTYSGTGDRGTHVFAQIVDEARGVVVGNQATPIPVTLDGQPHTITPPAGGDRRLRARRRALHAADHRRHAALRPRARRRGDHVQRRSGSTLPTAAPSAVSGGAGVLPPTRTCLSRRAFSIRVRGAQPAASPSPASA